MILLCYTNMTILILFCFFVSKCTSDIFQGPDPWNYETNEISKYNKIDIPPDLDIPINKQNVKENKGFGDWWFKRILAIVLKGGHNKKHDDGSVEVSIQMRFEEDRWRTLQDYLKSDVALTDSMFRRSVGYVEDAIYKPSMRKKIVMAWSEYIQVYLIEYKTHITWLSGIMAAVGVIVWLWHHISHKHAIIIIGVFLYIYEVIISYKEAEQQELEKFLSAVNSCKWYFWTKECDVPSPDLLIFMKHMNPLKIGIRMFTSIISEPIITLNSTIKITIQSMTDGLWFPFDKIVYMILIIVINISLIYLLIMVLFNFMFNIPFNLNFLGILSIGVKQRARTLFSETTNASNQNNVPDVDRISGDRLDRLLNVFSLALNNAQTASNVTNMQLSNTNHVPRIKRSASTGRLPNNSSSLLEVNSNTQPSVNYNVRRRNNVEFHLGGGDH